MRFTGELEIMEVITLPNGTQAENEFYYDNVSTLSQAQQIVSVEHIKFLDECVVCGQVSSYSVIARLVREGE